MDTCLCTLTKVEQETTNGGSLKDKSGLSQLLVVHLVQHLE